MPADGVVEPALQQAVIPKYSRYRSRSVRQANNIDVTPAQPMQHAPLASPPLQNANIPRSMSRYHRSQPTKSGSIPPLPQSISTFPMDPSHAASLAALTGEPIQPMRSHPRAGRTNVSYNRNPTSQAVGSSPRRTNPMLTSYDVGRQEARDILRAEEERIRRLKAQRDAVRDAQMAEERAKTKALELEQSREREAAAAAVSSPATANFSHSSSGIEHSSSDIGQDKRKRSFVIGRSTDNIQPYDAEGSGDSFRSKLKSLRHKASESTSTSRSRRLVVGDPRPVEIPKAERPIRSKPEAPTAVQPAPMGSNAMAFDAPISAVNAGERRVLIRCDESSITLPITPTTTAKDLINSASVVMSKTIDPQTSVLIESFTQLDLERPIRRYEHIRDVLNSWDNDEQNLFVISSSAERSETLLEAKNVPKNRPQEASFNLYHSLKPGKWDKRWIKLKFDGQMTVAKREGDLEAVNICHLSDFDIYTPTYKQMKKVKPPKKICFAIKSQAKSAMFLDGVNYAHFMATGDKSIGEDFYLAVQSWRSWYLVNQMGEGQNMQAKPANAIEALQRPSTASSTHSIPYQLGSFKPLLDFDLGEFTLNLNDNKPDTQTIHRRNLSSRDRKPPPSSFPNNRSEDISTGPSITIRRMPSANGRSNNTALNTESSSNLQRSTSITRGNSTRQKPKPLVDLTPQFKEAPQHIRIGRGVKAPEGQALIELATDVERQHGAIVSPPTHHWRRPSNPSPPQNNSTNESKNQAFTGNGLLARAFSKRKPQGAQLTGHGVKGTGGQPLVDLQLNSQFTEGSLLKQVEAYNGTDERGLIVDREKRVERTIKVGEGF